MIVTTCFGLLRPSSGFHPKVWWWCFIGLVWLCHDGEISAYVMLLFAIFKGRGGGGDFCCALSWGLQLKFVLITDTPPPLSLNNSI